MSVTTSTKTATSPAAGSETADIDTDVVIVGAGPVGLTLANLLALRGARAIVLEQRDELIDYPRGVGLDDESLRTIQAAGLIEAVLPHTAPSHIMRIVNGRGRVLAQMAPTTEEFGWSRRNAFVQPDVDRELYLGLARFDTASVRFGRTAARIREEAGRVLVTATLADGSEETIAARYLVGSDGGRSVTRKHLGVSFDGISPATRWLVVDLRGDPLGTPNVFLGADPRRPYVSLALPGAIRRFEFMLFDDESPELAESDAFVSTLLAEHVPDPAAIDPIRKRVFTHHSRIAGTFRKGRVLIAGDAAHLMPVWQGQGYNSGLRDATNLAWKLAAVVTGRADDALLDTYTVERHAHAKAMIDISTAFGRIVKPTNRLLAGARDTAFAALNLVPAAKSYFVQMRYKPMPRYERGVVVDAATGRPGVSGATNTRRLIAVRSANDRRSPVGTQFPQPRIRRADGSTPRLDDVLGIDWSVVIWGSLPEEVFGDAELAALRLLGARLITVRPVTQATVRRSRLPDAEIVGDHTGALKRWFDDRPSPVVFLRPDRFIAAVALIQDAPTTLSAVTRAAHWHTADVARRPAGTPESVPSPQEVAVA